MVGLEISERNVRHIKKGYKWFEIFNYFPTVLFRVRTI